MSDAFSAIITTGAAEKKGVVAPQLFPDWAVLDAELTVGLPAAVTAATGRRPALSTTGGTSDARFIKDVEMVADDHARADSLGIVWLVGLVPEPVASGYIARSSPPDCQRGPSVTTHGNDRLVGNERRRVDQLAGSLAGPADGAATGTGGVESAGHAEEHDRFFPASVNHRRAPGAPEFLDFLRAGIGYFAAPGFLPVAQVQANPESP